jgi:hypothetical protein
MAVLAISRATLPATSFGGGRESKPAIAIGDNGQIRFSTSLTADIIGKATKLFITWDPDTRKLGFRPVMAPPKGHDEDSLFPLSRGKDGESKQAYFGASALLASNEAGIKYDYKASGTQVIEPEVVKGKNGEVVTMYITLPNSLPPRPKQVRAKKESAPVAPAKTAPVDEDEID